MTSERLLGGTLKYGAGSFCACAKFHSLVRVFVARNLLRLDGDRESGDEGESGELIRFARKMVDFVDVVGQGSWEVPRVSSIGPTRCHCTCEIMASKLCMRSKISCKMMASPDAVRSGSKSAFETPHPVFSRRAWT